MLKFTQATLRRSEFIVLLTAILFVGVVSAGAIFAGLEAVWERLLSVGWPLFSVLLGCSLINYFLRGWRWDFFARALDIRLPWWLTQLYYMAGFSLAATPGKIGSALRLYLLKKGHGYTFVKTTPMYLLDQMTDLIAIFSFVLLGSYLFMNHWGGMLFIVVFVITALVLFYNPKWTRSIIKQLYAIIGKRKPRLFAKLLNLVDCTRLLMKGKTLIPTTALSIIGWAAEVYALWLILAHFGAEVTWLQATFIFGFATIVGALTLAPGGIGGNELTQVGLLLLIGVDKDVAVAAVAITRLTTLWFGVAIGFGLLPIAMGETKRQRRQLSHTTA